MKTKNLTTLHWFAAVFGCGFMLVTSATASAQEPLRPALILDVGAPQEVNAQPNFVMAQPGAPFAIPFRSTMGDSAYAAAKQRANSAYAYRLNTSTNAVRQSGFYFASHTSDDFNASITANVAGNCFVTWTSTDRSIGVNAQVRLSGKLSADAQITAGTAGFTSPTFLTGNFDPAFGTQRWGDYSAVTLDPSNGANAWLVNEKINNNSIWGSRIITIGF